MSDEKTEQRNPAEERLVALDAAMAHGEEVPWVAKQLLLDWKAMQFILRAIPYVGHGGTSYVGEAIMHAGAGDAAALDFTVRSFAIWRSAVDERLRQDRDEQLRQDRQEVFGGASALVSSIYGVHTILATIGNPIPNAHSRVR